MRDTKRFMYKLEKIVAITKYTRAKISLLINILWYIYTYTIYVCIYIYTHPRKTLITNKNDVLQTSSFCFFLLQECDNPESDATLVRYV